MPMARTNQPKDRRRTASRMRPESLPPARLPRTADAVTAAARDQWMWTVCRWPAKPATDLHGDDEQRRADRHWHGQAAEQDEGGYDEKAAAGADQSGDQSDGDPVRRRLGRTGSSCGTGGAVLVRRPRIMADGGGEHHQRERGQQHRGRDVCGEPATGVGAGHAGQRRRAARYASGPGRARACGTRPTALVMPTTSSEVAMASFAGRPGHVDQQGHGEDGAAAAEQTQADSDAPGERDGQRQGIGALRAAARWTVRRR